MTIIKRIASRKFTGEITALKDNFGFLLDNEEHNRYFHASFVKGVSFEDLRIGDRVEFTPFVGPRGRRAEDIEVIDHGQGQGRAYASPQKGAR